MYGKVHGADGIPSEIIEAGGNKLIHSLHTIIRTVWNDSEIPQDWKDMQLAPMFK